MADYSVIADVSTTILRLLRHNLCPEPMQSPEAIILCSPATKNADFQLGLFLYDWQEMGEMRSSAPIRNLDNTVTFPPRPLHLFYMLFLNAKAQIAAGAEDEQRILGRAMQTLMDNAILGGDEVPGLDEDEPAVSVTFQDLTFDDKTKIWSSLNIPYQTGVFFSVSPVLMSSRRVERVVRVTQAQFETKQREE